MPHTVRLRNQLVATALICMAIGNGIVLWKSRVQMLQGYGDFSTFYTAGVLVRRGLGTELYNPAAQWKVQQEFAAEVKTRRGPLLYMRPPFEAVFFSAFTGWPYPKALLLWTSLKLVLLSTIPFVMAWSRFWKQRLLLWAMVLLVLGTFPAFMDLLLGQDAPLLAFLFAISFWQLATERDTAAGFTLGLALFKFQLVIPFLIILGIAGRRRVFPGFAASASAVLALSVVIVGWKGLFRYPGYLLAMNRATGVGIVPENQMNLRALFTFLVRPASYPMLVDWVVASVALAAIVYAGFIWRKGGDRLLAEGFGLAAVVAIVTSYYASDYDLLLLIVPLLAIHIRPGRAAEGDRITRYFEAGGLFLLLLAPVYWLLRERFHAECLMTLPLLALGTAWARKLTHAGAVVGAERTATALEGPISG